MPRVKETHLWFEDGDDEIQVESYWKDLNQAELLSGSYKGLILN